MPLCISYIPVGLACGVLLQKLDLILSYQDCYRFWSFPVARSFSCIYAYDASIICNDIIDGFLFRITLYIIRSKSCRFYEKKSGRFGCLFQSLNDENYAVNYLKFSTDPSWNKRKALYVNWFSMTAWAGSNMIGNFSAR